jgi:pyruvate dehydrogenase E2 component (dihydrolipoamide acetyltransferase)
VLQSERGDATLTVTNLGDQRRERPCVIYLPQIALAPVRTPAAVGQRGFLGVRPVVVATLAADHRASDGHRGSRFLAAVDRLLQAPEQL